ncbi:hypothetical protein MTBUT4_700004 [Magnetospirillum sp. UT-4]|nr:hypothetical protein MTBUT4_700004 [Magnetospirillum sp. UT-4]
MTLFFLCTAHLYAETAGAKYSQCKLGLVFYLQLMQS